MKSLKMLAIAAVAAMAFTAFAASSASATTLEVNGVTQNVSVTLTGSLDTSLITSRTDGSFANTCRNSHFHATTTTFHNPVTAPVTSLTLTECDRPVTVHAPGSIEITHIAGTTNGTVFWENTRVTKGSPFGTLDCKTGPTTHVGTLTGKASGLATLDIHAVVDCGFLVPSSRWTASYWITAPSGLGVSA